MDAHIITLAEELRSERSRVCRLGTGDYDSLAEMLRTTAACNWDASRKDFVAAAILAGIHPDTARIQFTISRKVSAECDDHGVLQADGRIIYPN